MLVGGWVGGSFGCIGPEEDNRTNISIIPLTPKTPQHTQVSNYAGGFAANETGVRDAGSRGGNANKTHYPSQAGSQPGQQPGQPGQQQQQRSAADQYVSRQPQGYEAAALADYSRYTCILCVLSAVGGVFLVMLLIVMIPTAT